MLQENIKNNETMGYIIKLKRDFKSSTTRELLLLINLLGIVGC